MFIIDFKKPSLLIFYIIVILTGIYLNSQGIASVEKTVGIGIFVSILYFVIRSIIKCDCHNRQSQEPESKKDSD
ncbi:hypothetical protein [Candidatus Marinarcus aquaticus]|uniref:Uncharacterized protein n=1 Tax=Candidatus Marinarcus aquaticus TaxID=2044504 RepID=A0A4Q0XMM4_9BACT|nr:hypothetical protein [Candidatus Marinarcus aquaticus]RXJ54538.1 hypothetical protein CRV04_10905 [Candidatus Marinarcus aquaticus]